MIKEITIDLGEISIGSSSILLSQKDLKELIKSLEGFDQAEDLCIRVSAQNNNCSLAFAASYPEFGE